mgnify:CR=1 FL=1
MRESEFEIETLGNVDRQHVSWQSTETAEAIAVCTDLLTQFDDAPAYIEMTENASTGDGLEPLESTADTVEDAFDFDFGEEEAAPSADSELSLDEDFGLSFESNLTGETSESADSEEEFTLDVDDELSTAELGDDLGLDLDLDLGLDSDSAEQTDTPQESSQGADLDLGASEVGIEASDDEFTLDLEESDFTSDGLDLDLDLELDDASASTDFDLDLDLDSDEELKVDLELDADDSEVKTSGLDIMDFSLEDESFESGSLEVIEDNEPSVEVSEEIVSEVEAQELAVDDIDADLAALDTELDGDLALDLDFDTSSEDSEPPTLDDAEDNSFDLALEDTKDGDAFDIDMDDVDLDALDQEVDALSADLDVSEVVGAEVVDEPALSGGSDDFDLSFDDSDVLSDLDAGSVEKVEGLAEESEVDEIPVLGALEAEAETETEFDLAADLGLSAEDLEVSNASTEDEMFTEALSDLPMPEDVMADDEMTDEDLDAELDFLADTDEAATKLDLARAYIDMGDQEGAKDILDEVVEEGNDEQKQQAEELLTRMS